MVPVDECKLSILKKEHRIFCTFCASNSSYKMEGRREGARIQMGWIQHQI